MANGFEDELAMSAADVLAEQRRLEDEVMGRTYMGPLLTAAQEREFVSNPLPAYVNALPPPTPEAAAGAAGRVAEMTRPTYPTLASVRADPRTAGYDPEMQRFAARLNIEQAVQGGMPMRDAITLYGGDFFQPTTGGKRYNVAGVGLVDESGNVIAGAPQRMTRPITVAGVGLVDPDTGKVIVAPPETETVTDIIPAVEEVPAIPATPGEVRSRFGLDFLAKDIPPTPEIPGTPGKPAQRITRRVPIQPPSGATGKIRVRSPKGKLGSIPASQLKAALKQGYTQVR